MTQASTDRDIEDRDGEWARVGLAGKAALALAGTFIAIGLFAIGSALPRLRADFAGSASATLLIQLIGSVAAPVFALASPIAGRLVARYGVRSVYCWSVGLFALAGIAPALSRSLVVILVLRVVLGLAVAGGFTAGMVGIARLPERQRHGLYALAAFIGGGVSIVAYPVVGKLAASDWHLAFLVHLCLLPGLLLALSLPRNRAGAPAIAAAPSPSGLGGIPPRLLGATAILGWAIVSSSIYSPFYLAAKGVSDPARIGFILSILAMGSLVGSGSYGLVQARLGTRATALLGMALAAAGCATLAVAASLPVVMAGLGVMGAGLGVYGTAVYPLAIESLGEAGDPGAATGLVSLSLYLPQVLFPLFAAAVEARFGPPAVYAALAILIAGAMAALVPGRRRG